MRHVRRGDRTASAALQKDVLALDVHVRLGIATFLNDSVEKGL